MTTKRSTAARRGASRSKSSRSGTGRGRTPAKRSRSAESVWDATFFADHSADLWAIGLATVGVLLALALYGDAAGAFGAAVNRGLGAVIGWIRYLVPPVGVAAAVAVIVGRRHADPLRAGLAVTLGLLSTCGLADLAGGSPQATGPLPALRGAGGYIGAVFGHALQRGAGTAGATVIFLAAFVVAVVLSTGVSLSTFFAAVGVRRADGALGRNPPGQGRAAFSRARPTRSSGRAAHPGRRRRVRRGRALRRARAPGLAAQGEGRGAGGQLGVGRLAAAPAKPAAPHP